MRFEPSPGGVWLVELDGALRTFFDAESAMSEAISFAEAADQAERSGAYESALALRARANEWLDAAMPTALRVDVAHDR